MHTGSLIIISFLLYLHVNTVNYQLYAHDGHTSRGWQFVTYRYDNSPSSPTRITKLKKRVQESHKEANIWQ